MQTDVYTYPATSNKLSAISLGAGGGRAFTYDAAGNVTYDNRAAGGYGYTYNAAGRMSEFTISGVLKASYKYDFAGRQAIRTLAGGVTIHSVFDSAGNRIAEYNEATGALIREYVWFNGAPLAVIEGGVTTFIRTDHIGRPVFGTNTSGTKVWTASYLPFGGVRTTTGTPINARFPGQWFQSESGLHQNWMRDYDPTTGRYLQADPLGLVDGASIYGYAHQSPSRWTDPRGEETAVIAWEPRGWGSSSFGHASMEINGTAYSYGPNGMSYMPAEEYDQRNSFRDGFGTRLDLTPKQERELAQCLMEDQGEYSALNNSCTDPIETCLEKIGYSVGDSMTPAGMLEEIINSSIPQKGIVWKEPSDRSECGCAPWAK